MPEERPQIVLVNRCIIRNESGESLLLQRALGDRNLPGQWEFPGGKLDAGQDLRNALEREVLEETGLFVEPLSRLVYVDSHIISKGPYEGLPYVVLFGIAKIIGGKFKLSHEHNDSAWDTYDNALDRELTSECRKALIVLGETALR